MSLLFTYLADGMFLVLFHHRIRRVDDRVCEIVAVVPDFLRNQQVSYLRVSQSVDFGCDDDNDRLVIGV